MKARSHLKRRMLPVTTVIAEIPGLPASARCPYCGMLFDRSAPHLDAGGVGVAYAHVDSEQTKWCYSTLHARHDDVDCDSACVYEIGGESAQPDSEGGDTSSCGV